ncbi:hypothetical protein QX776_12075 [Alteromonadaceae bacterium BrNp21-10]|nr:hypothetical protein [Alteromonadaceae bacterium BrNp21-10]
MRNNKTLLVVVVMIIFALWDMTTRLIWEKTSNREAEIHTYSVAGLPVRLNPEQQKALLKQYQNYNLNSVVDKDYVDLGMSAEQQQLQHGHLEQLYSGDLRIRLSAVIREKQSEQLTFALLTVENIKDKTHFLEKAQIGQHFYGYVVKELALDHIILVSVEDKKRFVTLSVYHINSYKQALKSVNKEL